MTACGGRRTVGGEVSVTGVGIHTGGPATLTLRPADGGGVVFARTDLPGRPEVGAEVANVLPVGNKTALGRGGVSVLTVEHLLSALYAFGVDDVRCELDGPEVPAMDGSALPFVRLLREVGVSDPEGPREALVVLRVLEVRSGDRWARLAPAPRLAIDSTIAFDHPAVGIQRRRFEFSRESYADEIAPARTFGMAADLPRLREAGDALGTSLDNTLLVDGGGVANPGGMRFGDEFVRHKILDTLGDLALLGREVVGEVTNFMPGHALNILLCRELLARPDAWEVAALPAGPGAHP